MVDVLSARRRQGRELESGEREQFSTMYCYHLALEDAHGECDKLKCFINLSNVESGSCIYDE